MALLHTQQRQQHIQEWKEGRVERFTVLQMHHQGLHWLPQQAAAEVAMTQAAAAQAAIKTDCAKIHLRFLVFSLLGNDLWS